MITDSWDHPDLGPTTFTWRPDLDVDDVELVTQAYGVCLAGPLVCLIKAPDIDRPHLPGGTVEEGETLKETLRREVWEEANLRISDLSLLGLQEVHHEEEAHERFGRRRYHQSRFVCRVERAEPVTVDPDKDYAFDRFFVPLGEMNDYLEWGDVGDELVGLAKDFNV